MLEKIRAIITQNPDRKAFFTIIGSFFPKYSEEYQLISCAYDTAKSAFRDKHRESGERYFEHLRAVALILLVYLRVHNVNIIVAALLHDIMEDIPGWDQDRIALRFNKDVANLVYWVSKDDIAMHGGSKEVRDMHYHHRLFSEYVPRGSILIKLADRLHNLIMLWATSKEKQVRKIQETNNFYIQLAEKHTILIHELETAILDIEAHWNSIT